MTPGSLSNFRISIHRHNTWEIKYPVCHSSLMWNPSEKTCWFTQESPLVNRLSVFFLFRYFQTISSLQGCVFKLLEAQRELFQLNFLLLQPRKTTRKRWPLWEGGPDKKTAAGDRGSERRASTDPHRPAHLCCPSDTSARWAVPQELKLIEYRSTLFPGWRRSGLPARSLHRNVCWVEMKSYHCQQPFSQEGQEIY